MIDSWVICTSSQNGTYRLHKTRYIVLQWREYDSFSRDYLWIVILNLRHGAFTCGSHLSHGTFRPCGVLSLFSFVPRVFKHPVYAFVYEDKSKQELAFLLCFLFFPFCQYFCLSYKNNTTVLEHHCQAKEGEKIFQNFKAVACLSALYYLNGYTLNGFSWIIYCEN